MTAAHTAGPWEFVPKLSASENHKGFFIRAEKATRNGKWALAEVQPGDEDGKLGKANARLIAAAPDMLAEMRMFMPVLERLAASPMWSDFTIGTGVATINAFRAAIAKATGAAA